MLIFYIFTIIIHWNEDKIRNKKSIEYSFILNKILQGQIKPNLLNIPKKDKRYLRDLLLLKLNLSSKEEKETIKSLYKIWGMEQDDINQLKSSRWWKKVEALNKLEKMETSEAESLAIKLMESKKSEVRYAALKLLVSIKSKKIYPLIYNMFDSSSRWSYRYLVNILSNTNIPPPYLKLLAFSKKRDYRKASAILLGGKGNESALPLLEMLANDPIKDVRRESIKSLGYINTEKSQLIMAKHAEDQNYQIRAALAKAMSGYNNGSSFTLLEKLVEDEVFDVRLEAFYSLSKLGNQGKEIIEKYSNKYPNLATEFLNKIEQDSKEEK